MHFARFYDEDLAQASYLIGCQQQGIAVVVDPRRDVGDYLLEAERHKLRIAFVTETHIHADYLSGARELAHRTGGTLHLSAEGGPDWRYRFPHQALHDGSQLRLGNVTLRALHTPGHTPEHLSFLVTDGAASDQPALLLTGDFVFVGDVGRPDLLDETALGADSQGPMARTLFGSLKAVFWPLPDYLQLYPGHGAGSACGKALGSLPSSTVGYEKLVAWWSQAVAQDDSSGFVSELLSGQPDAPAYFARMKRLNRDGPSVLGERSAPARLSLEALTQHLSDGALLLDTRPRDQFQAGSPQGALHLSAGKTFATWAAWLLDPEAQPRALILLAANEAEAEALRAKLWRVGIDDVVGYVDTLAGLELHPQPQVEASELARLPDPFILDVRARNEFEAGHIPGAVRIHAGRLVRNLEKLPRERPIVVHCQSGNRSAAAASLLAALGFEDVYDLAGGYQAWEAEAAPAQRAERQT